MKQIVKLVIKFIIFKICLADVVYPEQMEADKRKVNLQGRIPLYAPTRCSKHQLLYPGDQVNDWICDCAPAAIYEPESDACHPAFRQGPCKKNEILVLGVGQIIPECIPNECKMDGKVQINNVCYEIGGKAPCPNPELSFVLGVDPITFMLDCIKLSISLQTRFGDDTQPYDLSKINQCARGTKRFSQGKCPTN